MFIRKKEPGRKLGTTENIYKPYAYAMLLLCYAMFIRKNPTLSCYAMFIRKL